MGVYKLSKDAPASASSMVVEVKSKELFRKAILEERHRPYGYRDALGNSYSHDWNIGVIDLQVFLGERHIPPELFIRDVLICIAIGDTSLSHDEFWLLCDAVIVRLNDEFPIETETLGLDNWNGPENEVQEMISKLIDMSGDVEEQTFQPIERVELGDVQRWFDLLAWQTPAERMELMERRGSFH